MSMLGGGGVDSAWLPGRLMFPRTWTVSGSGPGAPTSTWQEGAGRDCGGGAGGGPGGAAACAACRPFPPTQEHRKAFQLMWLGFLKHKVGPGGSRLVGPGLCRAADGTLTAYPAPPAAPQPL